MERQWWGDLLTHDVGSIAPTGAAVPYDAVIFDMDGVVTDTAKVHTAAWTEVFDAVVHDPRSGLEEPIAPFDPVEDLRRHVDGRPREDGIVTFLDSRGITMPDGEPGDPPDAWSVNGLAARKNELDVEHLEQMGVQVFEGTVDLIGRLRSAGVPAGLVTASRNATTLLDSVVPRNLFDVIIDGGVVGAGSPTCVPCRVGAGLLCGGRPRR